MLFEWLDVEKLSDRPRFAEHDRESYDALLALCEQLATDHFATHYRKSDTEEPAFDGEKVRLIPEIGAALEAFAKADLLTLTLDEELGGLQVPHVVASACMAWFTAANIGTAAYSFLTVANAGLLLAHGTPEQVERFVQPMLEGRFFGTMTLSEPHAGSSLGDVITRAVPADDGTHRIFGSKMWISGGDHEMGDNIVHLVLAKLPDAPAGSRGISLFIVPKWLVEDDGSIGERNDVALAGINHKLGSRGTVNTAPVFGGGAFTPGGTAGAVGLSRRGASQGSLLHVPHDERCPSGCRDVGDHHGLHGLSQVPRLRPRAPPGPAAGHARPDRAAGADHPARRRTPDAAGAEVLRRGCAGAEPLLLTAARRAGDRGGRGRTARGGPAPGRADADREVVALPVGAGEQQPGDPGARRFGLHA